MIAKAAVICVFLDRHQLHTVVAKIGDSRENRVSKFPILCDTSMHRTHSHMRFVYLQTVRFFHDSLVLEHIRNLWMEQDTIEKPGLVVLTDIGRPGWVSVSAMVVRLSNLDFVAISVLDHRYATRLSF